MESEALAKAEHSFQVPNPVYSLDTTFLESLTVHTTPSNTSVKLKEDTQKEIREKKAPLSRSLTDALCNKAAEIIFKCNKGLPYGHYGGRGIIPAPSELALCLKESTNDLNRSSLPSRGSVTRPNDLKPLQKYSIPPENVNCSRVDCSGLVVAFRRMVAIMSGIEPKKISDMCASELAHHAKDFVHNLVSKENKHNAEQLKKVFRPGDIIAYAGSHPHCGFVFSDPNGKLYVMNSTTTKTKSGPQYETLEHWINDRERFDKAKILRREKWLTLPHS